MSALFAAAPDGMSPRRGRMPFSRRAALAAIAAIALMALLFVACLVALSRVEQGVALHRQRMGQVSAYNDAASAVLVGSLRPGAGLEVAMDALASLADRIGRERRASAALEADARSCVRDDPAARSACLAEAVVLAGALERRERAGAAADLARLAGQARRADLVCLLAALAGLLVFSCSVMFLLAARGRLKRAQSADRAQTERLHAAVNHARDGLALFDSRDRLLLCNALFVQVTGLDGALAREGTGFDEIAAGLAAWQPALGGLPPPDAAELTELRRGGQVIELWRGELPDGGRILAVGDVTSRVQAEQTALQAHRMELLGRLAGGVAHDFNNLLQVISTNLEMVELRLEAGALQQAGWVGERVRAARGAVERGVQVTRHLLSLTRMQKLASRPTDAASLLARLRDTLLSVIGSLIEVSVEVAPGLHPVLADPDQMELALLNLALNARDAMPAGGRMRLIARSRADEPGTIAFSVEDQGAGMTPEQLSRAREPFFTTRAARQGLGLSMVDSFVRRSGGRLEFASDPGRGTCATLLLPAAPEDGVGAPAGGVPRGDGQTILLVEDEAALREIATEALQSLGYVVVAEPDADAAALRLEAGLRPALLFTDVVMPGKLSARALAARATTLCPDLPVLFTSGYAADLLAPGPEEAGAPHALLAKPWRIDELARRVHAMLRTPARPAPPPVPAPVPAPAPARRLPARVLYVEDDPLVREMTLEVLSGLGYEVRGVDTAEAALPLLPGTDLLVTDLGLPGMDGRRLAERGLAADPRLRVVIVSGRQESEEAPIAASWISKPYSMHTLTEAVDSALAGRTESGG